MKEFGRVCKRKILKIYRKKSVIKVTKKKNILDNEGLDIRLKGGSMEEVNTLSYLGKGISASESIKEVNPRIDKGKKKGELCIEASVETELYP